MISFYWEQVYFVFQNYIQTKLSEKLTHRKPLARELLYEDFIDPNGNHSFPMDLDFIPSI